MAEKKPADTKQGAKPGRGKGGKTATAAEDQLPVHFVDRLGDTFNELEQRIRERAYGIFLDRGGLEGDSVADWLQAQMEMVAPLSLDVKEQKKNIVVEANLKGFKPEEVEVEVEGDQLKVFGSHTETKSKRGNGGGTAEQSLHFYQSISLPDAVNTDACQAKLLKNGKLKITLPRSSA